MKKLMLLAVLVCCFAASEGTSRSSSDKIQVVYRETVAGEWRIHVFGPYCPTNMHLRMVEPKDASEPIELLCEYK